MDATVRAAPPPGSAQAGDLYVDLQSRTLWLGVDPTIDINQFVLISDIVALQDEIEGSLVEAKAYTDTKITTRAPTVHTHTSTQITDFTAAVTSVALSLPQLNWVRGMIIQWSGSLAEIGVGGLAGWTLCDGSNGSPDLRDRFILGAGSRAVGSKNPNASFNVANAGQHTHTVQGHAVTIAEMPYHDHATWTGGEDRDHQHYVNMNTGTENQYHNHNFQGPATASATGGARPSGSGGTGANIGTEINNQLHWHHVEGWTTARNTHHLHQIPAQGGNQAHAHGLTTDGTHTHAITSLDLRESIPFYALAFIMRL